MKKRMIFCLMLALVLVLAGCRKNPQETQPGEEETQPVEITEAQVGPLVDSIFDDDWDQDTQESEPTEEETADKDDDKDSTKPTEDKDDNKKPTEATRPGGDAPDTDGPVDPPAPDDPDPTNPGNKETEPTEKPGNNDPVEVPDPEDVDYREFMDMTPAEQQAFMESFESIEAFFEWYEAAKEKYEKENPPIDVGDGNVTLPGNP